MFSLYDLWHRVINEAAEAKAEEAWITSVCPEKGGKFPSCLPSDLGESTERGGFFPIYIAISWGHHTQV